MGPKWTVSIPGKTACTVFSFDISNENCRRNTAQITLRGVMRDNKPAREKIKGQIRSPRTSTKEFCAKPMCKEKTAPQFYHDDLNCKYRTKVSLQSGVQQ